MCLSTIVKLRIGSTSWTAFTRMPRSSSLISAFETAMQPTLRVFLPLAHPLSSSLSRILSTQRNILRMLSTKIHLHYWVNSVWSNGIFAVGNQKDFFFFFLYFFVFISHNKRGLRLLRLVVMPFCSQCGSSQVAGARFCASCGNSLGGGGAQGAPLFHFMTFC